MYADDTTLYCNINQDIGEEVINAELFKLWEWLGANKLSLNIAKTKYMVFHTSKRNVIYFFFYSLLYTLIQKKTYTHNYHTTYTL